MELPSDPLLKAAVIGGIAFFGFGMSLIGARDIERIYAVQQSNAAPSPRMVKNLLGQVDVLEKSEGRREEREQSKNQRRSNWEGVKGFMKGLIP